MGVEIGRSHFTEQDFAEFKIKLRKETAIFMDWLKDAERYRNEEFVLGLELETWIIDQNAMPSPTNERVLKDINHPLLVPELSKFNLEINAEPKSLGGSCFSELQDELQKLWRTFQEKTNAHKERLIMIGTLPTVRDEMLGMDYMSDSDRYRAMNKRIFELRDGDPIKIKVSGRDELESEHTDIMLEAAATSFQIHLQTPDTTVSQTMNSSMATSFAIIAAGANSPYLFGKDLWDETRITLFEQAVDVLGFYNSSGHMQNRVTFGGGYIRENLGEMFLENISSYDVLIPECYEKDLHWLSHMRLHNGNIWRWNRPIIGLDKQLRPSLRVEQRVLPSGPTTVDMIANMAFYVGLCYEFSQLENLAEVLPFEDARENFYAACKNGLHAKVAWEGKKGIDLQELLMQRLVPMAKLGLEKLAVDAKDIEFYLDEIMLSRIRSGQNGATWQRSWVAMNGLDFQKLVEKYYHLQEKGLPVHTWQV